MGKKFITPFGVLAIIAGAITLYFGYESGEPGTAAIGWILIIAGALVTLFGLQQYVSAFMNPPRDPEITHGQSEVRLLIQCMGVMARADGSIDTREIEIIEEIHARMLGVKINSEEVRNILSEFKTGFDIRQRLHESRSEISPLMKRKIVQACHLVMASDLKIRQSEVSKIVEIGEAVGFSKEEVDQIIAVAEI